MRFFALASVKKLLLATAAVALLALASNSSLAEDDPVTQAGRLSYLSGAVSIQQAGSDDWGQAYPNLPLGPGDRIFTDSDGRAEIQVGQSYVRIGPNSDVSFIDAAPYGISFGIAQGSVHVRSHGLWQGQYLHVNTPSGDATIDRRGEFRVDVLPDDSAAIFTSLSDDTFITGAGGFEQHLGNLEALELVGTNPVNPQWLQPADPDGLDDWSRGRDRQIANAISYRYVSPEIPGAAELDANGDWQPGTDYGAVWFPRNVPYGWAPYHNGHWVNHDPWGWVWVEDESWGYAPFHYGRWVTIDNRWGWVPGPPAAHPVWSPALVVFAGGIHVGGGGVSVWFPLGPGEAYRPWYHASPRYIDQVNISNIQESRHVHVQNTYVNIVNVTNVTNVTYINRTVGVTAMRHEDFAAGRPAQQAAVKVDVRELDHVQVLARPEPKPVPQSVVARPPARPVPVKLERPVFINEQGKQISAKPGAKPIEPPVKAVEVAKPLPGRVIIAPPPGATTHPAAGAPLNPARQDTKPPIAPVPTPGSPSKPVAGPIPPTAPTGITRPNPNPTQPPNARPFTPPAANPNPQPPQPPYARPNPNPAQPPLVRPTPPPAADPTLPPPQPPYARPNPNPTQPPLVRPTPPPAANPTLPPPQPPYTRPNPNPNPTQPPNARPFTPPAPNPNPQPPQPPYARPNPNPAQPPLVRPTPPPAANPIPQPPQPPYARPNPTPPPNARPFTPAPNPNPPPAERPTPKPYAPPPAPATQPAPRPAPPPAARPTPPPAKPQVAKPDNKEKDKKPE